MSSRVTPFLMFQGDAETALNFYISVIPDSKIIEIVHNGPDDPGKDGTISSATALIGGQTVKIFDSPIKHDFTFTPAISLFVNCDSEAELEKIASQFLEGGKALMPVDNYGFSKKFAWIEDRFGVSWQLNLA